LAAIDLIADALVRGWDNFLARTTGPLHLRFVLQPAVAALLAVRAGLQDARQGRPAFLWSVLTSRGRRWELLREALRDTSKVLLVAATLDAVYQLMVEGGVYVLELVFTALCLAFVPYVAIRGPVGRLAAWVRKTEATPPARGLRQT
jgi:hypothetical protein